MLTLDEPDVRLFDGPPPMGGLRGADDLPAVHHLFMSVRAWFDDAPGLVTAPDSDPLYRTHGDPRD